MLNGRRRSESPMKAVVIEAFGPPQTLKVRDFPTPKPGPADILVKVAIAGVCHHDVLHRAGKLPGAKSGVVPGHETAGEIVAVGAEVTTHAIGDRVVLYQRRFCGQCQNCLRGRQDMCRALGAPAVDTEGGYAEFISVPANMGTSRFPMVSIGRPRLWPVVRSAPACVRSRPSPRSIRATRFSSPAPAAASACIRSRSPARSAGGLLL